MRRIEFWIGVLAVCALALPAFGQNDWPVHRGNQERTGVVNVTDGPGPANITWWWPLERDQLPTLEVDDPAGTSNGFTELVDPADVARMAIGYVGDSYWFARCVAATDIEDSTEGSTKTFTWVLRPAVNAEGNYALYVQFPNGGTIVSGNTVTPNALFAVYEVEWTVGGVEQRQVFIQQHTTGAEWVRVGGGSLFHASFDEPVTLTLHNTVPLTYDNFGNVIPIEDPSKVIVVADAAYLARPATSAQTSPLAVTGPGGNKLIYATREYESVSPGDSGGSYAASTGEAVCVTWNPGDPVSPAHPVWRWSPAGQSNVNNVIDDTSSAFRANRTVWLDYAGPSTDYYGSGCVETLVTSDTNQSNWAGARWEPELSTKGNFDIYVWFPTSDPNHPHTAHATYVIHYFDGDDGLTEETLYDVDQSVGGKWVRLGNHSYPNDPDVGSLSVELVNYTTEPAENGVNYSVADAVMFVGDYESGMISSPAFYSGVRVKNSSGVVETKDVVFVADLSGHLYMLDAYGNNGSTWAYWSYPSVPNVNDEDWEDPNADLDEGAPPVGAFLRTSVCLARESDKDVVLIGASNGRFYAIDCTGRGDYDKSTYVTGTTQRIWTYPDAVPDVEANKEIYYGFRVDGSPAYSNDVVYVPTNEGRIYALDVPGNGDGTTDEVWIYPGRKLQDDETEENPIGAIQGTVTVADFGTPNPNDDLVVFGTAPYSLGLGGTPSGRVVALRAHPSSTNRRTDRVWVWPPDDTAENAIAGISYGGVTYVPGLDVYGLGVLYNVVITGTDAGRVYCLNLEGGSGGRFLWQSINSDDSPISLGGAIRSVPTFMQLLPRGSTASPVPAVMVTTAAGEVIGLRATDSEGEHAGRGIWAVQSTDNAEVFGSLAVSDGFVYALNSTGRLLAFSPTAVAPGYDISGYTPVQEVEPPDEDTNPDVASTQVKRINREDYNKLRALQPNQTDVGGITPYTARPLSNTVLEWGETVYMVAYDFHVEDDGGNVTFQLKGNSNTPRGTAPIKKYTENNLGRKDSFALYAYVIQGSRQAPFTPGDEYWVEATVRPPNASAVGPFEASPRPLIIANPIAITMDLVDPGVPPNAADSIGWTNQGTADEAKINGSGAKGDTVFARQGEVSHGQRGGTRFMIADRSLLVFSTGRPLRFVMAARHDMLFSGGATAVYKALPWDIMPVGTPNPSPDYPDIDRRQVGIWADPFGSRENLLTNPIDLNRPQVDSVPGQPPDVESRRLVGTVTGIETQVPLYQPANFTNGYIGKVWVFVDVNNDRLLSGVTTSATTDLPGSGAEPFRTFRTNLTVPPDEKIVIVEPTVDLGSQAHGTGMTPHRPRDNQSLFYPGDWVSGAPSTYDAFFQPFTVQSYSNVNLLNLRTASLINQVPSTGPPPSDPLVPIGFFGDGVSPLAWLGADQTLVTNLDPRFSPQVTLHKPRPGDRGPTSLRLPDAPYGTLAPLSQPPMVGVAIPLGHPVGAYSQFIRVFEDEYGGRGNYALDIDPATNHALETITEPTMKVKFLVREGRLTNGTEPGTLPQLDYPLPAEVPFRFGNVGPAAFRHGGTGSLLLAFASQRTARGTTTGTGGGLGNWSIYTGILKNQGTQLNTSVIPPLADMFGWESAASDRWWNFGSGPYPTGGPASLFEPGLGNFVPNSEQYFQPSFPVNVNFMPAPYLFWEGSVKRDYQGEIVDEYGIFYAPIDPATGRLGTALRLATGDPNVPNAGDARMPRFRPVAMGVGNGARLFWYGGTTGRYGIFVNETDDLASGVRWNRAEEVNVPDTMISTKDPYPVLKANGDIDIIYSGISQDRNTNEIFLTTFGPRNPGGSIDWTRSRTQPRIFNEAAVMDPNGKVWRTRGLDWDTGGSRRVIDVKVNGVSILSDRETDSQNDLLRYESSLGGYVVIDPEAGTIRFPNIAPGRQDLVTVTYTPRTIRVTPLGNVGGNTEPVAFIDTRPIGELAFTFRPNNDPAGSNDAVPADRYWFLYKRGGTATGQPTTLYMQTYRPGVVLPTPVAVSSGSRPVLLTVSGAQSYYSVDPTVGRVYFTQADIGRTVSVTYRPPGGGDTTLELIVGWIPEMSETTAPIERAIAEDQVSAFADPFIDPTNPRPGFIWLFWSSTRNGASYIYFETVSPRYNTTPAQP